MTETSEKGAIGFAAAHSAGTAKAAPETVWIAPREVAGAVGDVENLRRMHAWVDSDGHPTLGSSYRLPHHTSEGVTVLRAVRAAVAKILVAGGDDEIPAADKRAAFEHLAEHLREFDVEVPEFVKRNVEKFDSGEVADADETSKIHKWALNGTEQSWSAKFEVKKIDDEQGNVFGWASVSERADGSFVFDHEEDGILPDVLEKAAYEFNLEARKATDSHDIETLGAGQLVESMFFSKEKQDALGISVPVGWWVGFHIDDPDMRKMIRETGERAMFSIGGTALRTEL